MAEQHIGLSVIASPSPGVVHERHLCLPQPVSAGQAVQASGLLELFELGAVNGLRLGVWGRLCSPETALREADRVEIYRPLTVDPKVARRERFRKQGSRASGLFAQRRPGAKPGY